MMRHWHHALSDPVSAPRAFIALTVGAAGFILFDKEDSALCDNIFRRTGVEFLLQF